MKVFGWVEGDPRTKCLDFGGDGDHDPDPRFLDAACKPPPRLLPPGE